MAASARTPEWSAILGSPVAAFARTRDESVYHNSRSGLGEHPRPRVSFSAPSRKASAEKFLAKPFDSRFCSTVHARARPATRGARVLPLFGVSYGMTFAVRVLVVTVVVPGTVIAVVKLVMLDPIKVVFWLSEIAPE